MTYFKLKYKRNGHGCYNLKSSYMKSIIPLDY